MTRTTLALIWSPVCVHLIYLSPIFTLILVTLWPRALPEGNTWLFSSTTFTS